MPEIRFTVIGKPQPAGSKNSAPYRRKDGRTGVATRDSNPKAKPWQAIVANAAREAYSGDLLRGPLFVRMTFYLPRPKGHYGTGRNATKLKPSAPPFPTVKPDALKLARGTEDALTGVIWGDDAQVVSGTQLKLYGEPARVEVQIEEVANMKTWQPWTITDGTLQLTEWPDHGPGVVVGDESMNWRPIETAPKDGTEVWLWVPDCGRLLCRYTCMAEFLVESELRKFPEDEWWELDWFYADFLQGNRLTDDEPTHWMPLPDGPTESGVKP